MFCGREEDRTQLVFQAFIYADIESRFKDVGVGSKSRLDLKVETFTVFVHHLYLL